MLSHYKLRSRVQPKAVQSMMIYRTKAKLWIYSGAAAWHFITLPKLLSKNIKRDFGGMARGWGSLPVTITIGTSTWKTSIFPDTKAGAYLLPIKALIRKKENLKVGQQVSLSISL